MDGILWRERSIIYSRVSGCVFFIPICSVEEYNVSVLKCELKNDAQTKLSDSIVVSIQSSDDLYNKNKAKTHCNKIRFKTTLCI